jgi:hypothetical protein
MANHGFRKTGTTYISKAGHDSNAGTDPNAPRKTIGGTAPTVIGAGVYYQATPGGSSSAVPSVMGDGLVIIDAEGASANFSGHNTRRDDIWYRNFIVNSTGGGSQTHLRCIFQDCTASGTNGIVSGSSAIYLNCTFNTNNRRDYNNCIFINANIIAVNVLRNCYVGPSSNITILNTATAADINYNNIEGTITMLIDGAVSGGAVNGVALSLADHQIEYPTFNVNSFDADPEYNSVAKLDFHYPKTGPHLLGGWNFGTGVAGPIGPTHIGYGLPNYVSTSNSVVDPSNPDVTSVDLVQTGGNLEVDTGAGDEGSMVTAPRLVNDFVAPLTYMQYLGELNFDANDAGGTATNKNVPDNKLLTADYPDTTPTTDTGGSASELVVLENLISIGDFVRVAGEVREVTNVANAAGEDTLTLSSALRTTYGAGEDVEYGTEAMFADLNPNRLSYEMRWSTQADEPATDGEWDNEALITAGTYEHFEWNAQPLIDSLSRGNGRADFDTATGMPVNARWIQLRIRFRNNYAS